MGRDSDYSSGGSAGGFSHIIALFGAALVALVLIIGGLSAYYTVGQGEKGVVTRYGAVVGESGPGLHFKLPYTDSVEDISIQPIKTQYGGKDTPVQAYSSDQQPADLTFAVNWHVTDASSFYSNFYSVDQAENRVLTTKVLEVVKNVFGRFEAASAIQKRAELNLQITNALEKVFAGQPFRVDSFQMEDITFSNKYEAAVEDRMEATVRQQQAEFAKQKRIIDADAAAYEVKAAADAKAHQIDVEGQAQANAIKARAAALQQNPELVALTLAERWNGQTPNTVLPNSSAPFVSVK